MGRPRRPLNGVETIEARNPKWLKDELARPLGNRQERRFEASQHWAYTVPNGLYDPLTYLFVLDGVANINPEIELRSKNLAEWLNRNKKAFHWDPITVGKVLTDLKEAFEDVLGERMGILMAGSDYKGNFWLIQHNPDTARTYVALREDLMRLAEHEITARMVGTKTKRLVSPLLECPTARGAFVEV